MSLLLCAATPFEIRPLTEWISRENIRGVDVLITGVGLTAATYSLTKAVLTQKPRFLLQAGVAGGFDTSMKLGSVVAIRSEIIGDQGVYEQGRFQSLFDLKLLQPNDPPWTNGRLYNKPEILERSALPAVDSVAINEISTNTERIEAWRQENIAVESMEGAALHYVALLENIPFLQIRSLSNFVGERDKSKWVMADAITRLNKELKRIVLNLLNT
jgi:futalosine hydrolase